jgi:hypothetical protein
MVTCYLAELLKLYNFPAVFSSSVYTYNTFDRVYIAIGESSPAVPALFAQPREAPYGALRNLLCLQLHCLCILLYCMYYIVFGLAGLRTNGPSD